MTTPLFLLSILPFLSLGLLLVIEDFSSQEISLTTLSIYLITSLTAFSLAYPEFWSNRALQGLGASAFMLVIYLISGRKMGLGDVFFVFPMGLILGFWGFQRGLFYGAIVALPVMLILQAFRGKSPMAFIPFLYLGALVEWGVSALGWYPWG